MQFTTMMLMELKFCEGINKKQKLQSITIKKKVPKTKKAPPINRGRFLQY